MSSGKYGDVTAVPRRKDQWTGYSKCECSKISKWATVKHLSVVAEFLLKISHNICNATVSFDF